MNKNDLIGTILFLVALACLGIFIHELLQPGYNSTIQLIIMLVGAVCTVASSHFLLFSKTIDTTEHGVYRSNNTEEYLEMCIRMAEQAYQKHFALEEKSQPAPWLVKAVEIRSKQYKPLTKRQMSTILKSIF
jgi:hypothetical protein